MSIPTALNEALQKQAEHERFAAAAYLSLSYWCAARDFSGFAGFFARQSAEEIEHMEKINSFLLDRGSTPLLEALPAPDAEIENLKAVAKCALDLETTNTAGIHAAYKLALEEADYPSQVLLQWFISEQVEEEAWANKMVTLTDRADCCGALQALDRHIERELGGK